MLGRISGENSVGVLSWVASVLPPKGAGTLVGTLALLWAASVGAPGAVAAGAKKTFDVDFRVYCEPASNYGGNLCFKKSGWASASDIRADYQRFVMPVLNQVFMPAGISFRFHDLIYNDKNVFFSAVTASTNNHPRCPNSLNEQAVKAMRELAADPANRDRLTIFALPRLCHGWSAIPPAAEPGEHFGVFVSVGISSDAYFLAHEIAHHFCLAHTQSHGDAPPGSACGTANHDGDGLQGTPPDPGPVERVKMSQWITAGIEKLAGSDLKWKEIRASSDLIIPDSDEGLGPHPHYSAAMPIACHEWCDWSRFPVSSPLDSVLAPLKQKAHWCVPSLYRVTEEPASALAGPVFAQSPPHMQNITSYYFRECSGPVVFGKRREALVQDQIDRIATCIEQVAERADYSDACAGLGGDSDSDGICDFEDGCPTIFNAGGLDSDEDGTPDACDLCPTQPDTDQLDTDGDGVGDACDENDDNDACLDEDDQHPGEARVVVGTRIRPGCDPEEVPFEVSESGDSDGDGIPDCADSDDDNDLLADEFDPCPLVKGTEGCRYVGFPCPPAALWPKLCEGPGCDPLFSLVMVSLVNPAEEVAFHGFQIRGDRIYVSPRPGVTTEETLDQLLGGAFSPGPDDDPPILRLEIRSRSGDDAIPVLESFQAVDLETSMEAPGRILMLDLADPSRVVVSRVWGAGLDPLEPLADEDGDGLPDVADNCTARANADQIDADGDGFGDVCDLDLDNDGLVTATEVAYVEECESVRLRPAIHLYEEGETLGDGPVPLSEMARRARCALADLDDSGVIDAADVREAAGRLGRPPGPSGLVGSLEPAGGSPRAAAIRLWLVLALLAVALAALLGRRLVRRTA